MPRSTHIHKSMLLRGVKFPTPALNQDDIQATKGRAANPGRNPGGYSQRGQYGGGRGRGSYNRGNNSSNPYPRQQTTSHQSYSAQTVYNQYSSPSQGWQPPPPGLGGFARNPPPPPPGMHSSYAPGHPSQTAPFNGQYGSQYPAAPGYPQYGDNRTNESHGNTGSGHPRGHHH